MGAQEILAMLGAVPAGARPKTILAGDENQEPGYYQTDPLSNTVRGVNKYLQKQAEEQEKRLKQMERQSTMFNTLRVAGYDPKSAYDAVMHQEFPGVTPGTGSQEELDKLDIEKKQAEIEKIKSETNASKPETIRTKILTKIINGEMLSPGEQKVYEDTISKGKSAVGGITKTQATNIIADPIKAQQLKNNYPDIYSNLETIAKEENSVSKGSEEEEITLPSTITSTSQAIDYLMKNYKMTKEQAVEWIRSQ